MRERLVPELVQDEFTPEALVELAIPLLEDSEERSKMLDGYKRFRMNLGQRGATDRAAKEVLDLGLSRIS